MVMMVVEGTGGRCDDGGGDAMVVVTIMAVPNKNMEVLIGVDNDEDDDDNDEYNHGNTDDSGK